MAKQQNNGPQKPGGKNPQLVVNQITIQPIARNTADIDTWRNALRAADRGKRKQLYELYEDLLLDPILSDAIDKRIEAITNAELVFRTGKGESVPVMDDLMDTPEFEEFLKEAMRAHIVWGISVEELDFSDGFSFQSVPRAHIRPETGEIVLNVSDEKGIPYRDSDFFLEIGDKKDLGLVLKAAPYVIYKRGGFGDWAQYVEIFGMPFQIAKYSNYDEATRQELIRALEASGSARRAVIPKESDIDYRDNKSSGDGGIYEKLRMACIEEILICILGQTMTTLDGSSRSQGEVHLEVLESKHKADRRFVQRILNRKLVPILAKRGYPVGDGYFMFPETGETVSLTERMALVEKAAAMVPVPADYIYETFGVPKPKEGEEVVQIRPASPFPIGPEEEDPEEAPENSSIWSSWLRSFFVGAPEAGASGGTPRMMNFNDSPEDDFNARLAKKVARGEAYYFDAELFNFFASGFTEALGRGFTGKGPVNIGLDYGLQNDVVRTAMETNLFHFSAAKTLAELQQLNQIFQESKSPADFLKRAKGVTDVFNETWARTEYQTANAVAERTADYFELISQPHLFPYWEYRTAGDDKVREEHRELDGVILPANDPRWGKIYPPNGWSCRCYVVARMAHEFDKASLPAMRKRVDDYFDTADYKNAKAQGFGVNRALAGEVFTENQMYIRKFPAKAAKHLDRLGAADYSLPAVTKAQQIQATQPAPLYKGTPEEWRRKHENQGKISFTDYNGRQVTLPAKNFTTHTTGKKQDRVAGLDAIADVVKTPSEVWLNNEQPGRPYENYTIIKYYTDEIMVVCCRITGGQMNEIRTWYPMRLKREVVDKCRRGLLVYTEKAPR